MKNVNLVDVVADRIKGSALGDLIGDADLYDIVKQGIEKAFFEKREKLNSGWNRTEYLPPLVVETIQAAFKDALKPHVDRYIAENGELIAEHLKKAVEGGFIRLAEQLVAAHTINAIKPTFNQFIQIMNDDRQRQGLPPLPVMF